MHAHEWYQFQSQSFAQFSMCCSKIWSPRGLLSGLLSSFTCLRLPNIEGPLQGNEKCHKVQIYNFLSQKEELSARPPIRPNNECRPGWELPELDGRNPGIILCHGRYWRDQRRFTLRHLRDFGFGKTSMEDILTEEVHKLVQAFRKQQNQPLNLNRTMNVSILNALWSIVVGDRFELDDPKLSGVIQMIDNMLKVLA